MREAIAAACSGESPRPQFDFSIQRMSARTAACSSPNLPKSEEVEHLLRNAQLRDELEPLFDESIDRVNPTVMSTRSENEFLESMLEWERAPMLPISQWFEPPLVLPHPDRLGQHQLSLVLRATIEKLFEKHIVLDFTDHLSDYQLYGIDLSRHSSVARKDARAPHELSALGLREHGGEPGHLAALLRERSRARDVGRGKRPAAAAARRAAVPAAVAAGAAVDVTSAADSCSLDSGIDVSGRLTSQHLRPDRIADEQALAREPDPLAVIG